MSGHGTERIGEKQRMKNKSSTFFSRSIDSFEKKYNDINSHGKPRGFKKVLDKQIKKVIFIIADTLRAQNVGIYGANPSPTPNIDELGRNAVVFSNTYSAITCTDPSISSIMTGKYPLTLGIMNHGLHVKQEEEDNLSKSIFLPEILQKHQYETVAIDWLGRWHKRGYDYYSGKLVRDGVETSYPIAQRLPFPLFMRIIDKFSAITLKRIVFNRAYYALHPKPKIPYDPADVVVDKAIELLQENKKKELFLYLHFWDAHAPHTRPRGFRSYLFDNIDDTYNAEISFLDEQIGRLIEYLRKTSQLEEAIIVFTADHGENFYEHDIPFNHENLYEDVVRVPMFFVHKSFVPQKVNALVRHIDILPTMLDLLGIPLPQKDIDGKSLIPLMSGSKKTVRDFAYFEDITYRRFDFLANKRRRGIRVGNYKYIETLTGKNEELYQIMPKESLLVIKEELYELQDFSEKENLIYKKPIVAKKLRKELHAKILESNRKRLRNNVDLYTKVKKSLSVIRKAGKQFKSQDIAIAWTGGKDSTVLLHLVRIAFNGKIPFKVMFNDSTMEFKEIYKFIEKISKLWNIDLITIKHSEKELKEFQKTKDHEKKKELSRIMKITAINSALKKYKIKAFMAGIRWDEHESRSKEKYFSPRPDHIRIHPILHFTEKDIWKYIKHFGVPYVDLYSKGYRSLGEKPFTKKAKEGEGERSGRERDKEQLMGRLRKMGYW